MARESGSVIILGNRLLIIVIVLSFATFPKVLLRWVPLNRWMIIFVVGIVVFGALEIGMRYKQARSDPSNRIKKS